MQARTPRALRTVMLNGHNRQPGGHMGKNKFKLTKEIQLGYVVKYKVRKMAKGHHCYYPMLLMRATKTAVCLQTKATFHHLYGF